jgi:hypothetical protein
VVDERPRQLEALREVLRQRLDSKGLGGIVATVQYVDAEFFRVEIRPVLAFTGDEGVEARLVGLADLRSRRASYDADATSARGPRGDELGRRAEHGTQRVAERLAPIGSPR